MASKTQKSARSRPAYSAVEEDWQFLQRPDAVVFLHLLGLEVPHPETEIEWLKVWALIGWELYEKKLHTKKTGRKPRWNQRASQLLIDNMKISNKDWSKKRSALGYAKHLHKNYPNEFKENPETLARSLSPIFKALRQALLTKTTQ